MGRREENTDLLVTGGRSVVGGHRWEAVLIHDHVVVVTAAAVVGRRWRRGALRHAGDLGVVGVGRRLGPRGGGREGPRC